MRRVLRRPQTGANIAEIREFITKGSQERADHRDDPLNGKRQGWRASH